MTEARLSRFAILLTLLFLFVLTQWSSSVYLPIAPQMAQLFSGQGAWITVSLSWFFVGYAVGQIFWGILSDFIGRYRALLSSLTLYVIFEALIAFTPVGAIGFVLLLTITGFAIAANTAVGNALIKDRYQSQAKSIIAYVGIAMASAPVVAPVIGARLFSTWGWQSIFVFLFVAGVMLWLLFAIFFCGSHHQVVLKQPGSSVWYMLREVLGNHSFMHYIVLLACSFGIFFSLLLVVPFMLEKLGHLSVDRTGDTMLLITMTYIIGSVANSVLIRRIAPARIIKAGLLLLLLGGICFVVISFVLLGMTSPLNLVAVAWSMLGIGAILPAAKAGAMIQADKHVGTAASVMKFIQTLGCVILTRAASACINAQAIPAFLIALVVLTLLLVVYAKLSLRR